MKIVRLVTASLLSFATTATQAAPPNVLLITSEDNGPHLSCYGDPNIVTPNLDQLAADGIRFANAYVTYSVCSPSRASILTGLYNHQNGHIGLATHRYTLFRNFPNIPGILKQNGYRTGIIGKLHVNPASAFPFDFQAFTGSNFGDRPMRRFADKAREFINGGEKPFFLMVNFPDAHFPLIKQQHGLPENPISGKDVKQLLSHIGADSPRLRQHVADYYNCLLRLDAGVGMLLDVLRKSVDEENTLVIYLGDHGAQFSRGKTTAYEGGLRVPMMLRWPARVKAGQVREELVSSVDILPTIISGLAIDGPGNLPGYSLLDLNNAPDDVPWRRYLFTGKAGSTAFWAFPQRTVRDERFKLILNLAPNRKTTTVVNYEIVQQSFFVAGTNTKEIESAPKQIREAYETWRNPPAIELYDLQNDPDEWKNLAKDPDHAGVRTRLLAALREWRRMTSDPFADPARLAAYLAECDEIYSKYGGAKGTYRRDKNFKWRYPDYLQP